MKEVMVLTGGAGGMGLATARLLGDYHVVLSDSNEAQLKVAIEELRELGVTATPVVCDITDRSSVEQLLAEARTHGTVRGVVHAAGVSPHMGDAEYMVRVNALGTMYVTEVFLEQVEEGATLVNVSSIAGHMLPRAIVPLRSYKLAFVDARRCAARLLARVRMFPRRLQPGMAYSLSKHFVVWYSARMATKFGARGARIVSVSPGTFDTAMGRLEDASGAGQLAKQSALGRSGRPEEVAELLAFLVTGKAFYMTGTDILIDGGAKAGMTIRRMVAMSNRQ